MAAEGGAVPLPTQVHGSSTPRAQQACADEAAGGLSRCPPETAQHKAAAFKQHIIAWGLTAQQTCAADLASPWRGHEPSSLGLSTDGALVSLYYLLCEWFISFKVRTAFDQGAQCLIYSKARHRAGLVIDGGRAGARWPACHWAFGKWQRLISPRGRKYQIRFIVLKAFFLVKITNMCFWLSNLF